MEAVSEPEGLPCGQIASVGCDIGCVKLSKVGHEQAAQQPRLLYKFLTTPRICKSEVAPRMSLCNCRGFTAGGSGRLDPLCVSQPIRRALPCMMFWNVADTWEIESFVGVLQSIWTSSGLYRVARPPDLAENHG